MLTDDPAALKLLLTDDLYLLKADRTRIAEREKSGGKKAGVEVEAEAEAKSEPPATPTSEPEKITRKISFAGSMANGCLVLLDEPGFETLSPDSASALGKIFSARKTSLEDAGLINLANTPVTFPQVRDDVQPKTIIMLGVDTDALDLDKLA
ncbi:MAG: hypothetical protein INR69_20060, partial [Mucilaginibacter polytrichastri]|nr:hypothetical protein [Mucilaginibacter polytrichastri]